MKTLLHVAVAGVVVLAGVAGVNSAKAQASSTNVKAAVTLNDGPIPACEPSDKGCTMPGLDPK